MNWLFARVNPLVVWLARSFAHRLISARIVVLGFSGRRSGNAYQIPVSYVRDGQDVLCMTARSGIWWQNLQGGAPVQLTVGGGMVPANSFVETDDREAIAAALRLFCLRYRTSAYFAGVGFDKAGEPRRDDLQRSAQQQVLIRLRLDN